MISNAADEIATIVNKLTIEVIETEEEFVWTQVEPWLSHTMERHISKRELVEALEKQMPKKPINWLGKMIICPRCNRADYMKPLESYCKFCGQAIDWNQEDD